ncbi:hypothetical protein BDW59DRAFT_145888 [Aspergillus cavernicola]|uniref:Uncharacterized protein n=1 Tax=Aspergillus cavernicola TaxID=176166 RepID=A0ABR4IDE2_9EURO
MAFHGGLYDCLHNEELLSLSFNESRASAGMKQSLLCLGYLFLAAFRPVLAIAWPLLSITLPKLGLGLRVCCLFRPQRDVIILVLGSTIFVNITAVIALLLTVCQCNPVRAQSNLFEYSHP